MIDKNNFLKKINNGNDIHLEFGCGFHKSDSKFIGIDILDTPSVDIIGDVFEILSKIGDQTVDSINSSHFLEHIDELPTLLKECSRVLKPGAIFYAKVPHFSNPYFYSDFTHQRFFGLYTFQYLTSKRFFHRKTPNYMLDFELEIVKVKILFGAERPFYIKYAIGKIFNLLFNVNKLIQEYYETNLTKLFPCSELEFYLMKK